MRSINFDNNQYHQRLRNEIIASAAELEAVSDTIHKRPLRPLFWEKSIPDIDGGVSCNTESRSMNRKTVSFIAILIVCLAIVAVGSLALTYWIVIRNVLNNRDGINAKNDDTNNVASANDLAKVEDVSGSQIVLGEFRITNRVFNDALTLWSSKEFEILTSEVIKSMDEVFMLSPLSRVYNFTRVTGFSKTEPNGVIVALRISLNRALIKSAQELGLTFVSALEHGHGRLPGGSLRVDIRTIKFTETECTSKVSSMIDNGMMRFCNIISSCFKTIGDVSSKLHDDSRETSDITTSMASDVTDLQQSAIYSNISKVMINDRKNRIKRSSKVIRNDYRTKSFIPFDLITNLSYPYFSHDAHTNANDFILNIKSKHQSQDDGSVTSHRDNHINDFLENNRASELDSHFINDASVLDMHANDENKAHEQFSNVTITNYSTRMFHWVLNESTRSLSIAISETLSPITLSNDEKSEYDNSASASPSTSKESLLNNSAVSWSDWSEWSPCHGINRTCDSGRIHSRIRKCIAENGDVVNSDYCRINNGAEQELEIRDCRCDDGADKIIHDQHHTSPKLKISFSYKNNNNNTAIIAGDVSHSAHIKQRDRPCTDCKENEICLIQAKSAVSFCAKMKDPGDPRGCGGWCSGHKEVCRYVGSNTYQCVDDSECLEDEWQCDNGLCIPVTRRCDGHFNCFDMSDEMHCQCKDDEFHCGNKTSCLTLSHKCNGIIDCWDGEDEQNCTKLCSDDDQYACNTGGQCIALHEFCDSYKQCDDGSDEPDGCSDLCLSNEHQCKNGRCVPTNEYCDGINNCGDNSDEIDCPSVLATNSNETPKKDFGHFTINNPGTSAPSVIQTQSRRTRLPLDAAISTKTTLVKPSTVMPFANKRTVNR